jgi:hypothetical protein
VRYENFTNGAMRTIQGGKFEHGFLSGFACAEQAIFLNFA